LRAPHHRQRLLVARDHQFVADHLDTREVRIATHMVRMRLGIDQLPDRPVLEQPLPPLNGIDRLLRRIDHEDTVSGCEEARVTAPEVHLREDAVSNLSHQNIWIGGRPVRSRL
jgi:hypothetical protein